MTETLGRFLLLFQCISSLIIKSGNVIAKDFNNQRREFHAVLRLEGDAAILLGMLLVEASQVCKFLDHFGIQQAIAWRWVSAENVGLQDFRKTILNGLH